jgi:hypothetical protein
VATAARDGGLELLDAIAQPGRHLVPQARGQVGHLGVQFGDDRSVIPLEEGHELADLAAVGLAADQRHAGGRAAPDLMVQAGTSDRAIG